MLAVNPLLLLLEEQALRIDALEGQVQDLTLALRLDATANVQAAFSLAETLAQVLILLSDGKPRSKEQIHGALYFRRPDVDAPEIKITDTLLCKLRKQIAPHGVRIITVWGSGYQIVAGLHVVRSAIEYATADGEEAARQRQLEYFRERQRRLRAAEGRKDRQTYLQHSLSRLKPWEELGISRRQWERRRVASLSAANDDTRATSRIAVTA